MNSFNSLQTAISHLELQGFHSSLADYLHGYMTSTLASIVIIVCFGVLMVTSVTALTGAHTTAFFTANRQSLQYLVAFGMTGFPLVGSDVYSCSGKCWKNWIWTLPGCLSFSLSEAGEPLFFFRCIYCKSFR